MDEQIIPTAKPTLEEVRQRFERWRESQEASHRDDTGEFMGGSGNPEFRLLASYR